MKKSIFIVPILSLIASIAAKLILRIVHLVINANTPAGEIYISSSYNYILFAISIVLIIIIGIVLRIWNFDKKTIFKSTSLLAIYIAVILAVTSIYTKVTAQPMTPGGIFELWLNYPFYVYESIQSIVLTISASTLGFWISKIAIVLFPYILVIFGKKNQ